MGLIGNVLQPLYCGTCFLLISQLLRGAGQAVKVVSSCRMPAWAS